MEKPTRRNILDSIGGSFDKKGRFCVHEAGGITMQSFWSIKKKFAWIPKSLFVFDYSIMDYKKTGKWSWMKFVIENKNDYDGSKYFSEIND